MKFQYRFTYIIFLCFVFCIYYTALSQPPTDFLPTKNYFRNPLNIKPILAGNFGHLRSNHYHMGIDFRTNKTENLPVYAAADGYISQIRIEPYGYGKALYIIHPNGLTTLYAHLNKFSPALEAYVRERQYENKSWKININFNPNIFPVKKGELIAWSGNSGSTEGPHLHFEIRDTKTNHNLNPMLFGLGITDIIAPSIHRLAIHNRNESIYESAPVYYNIKQKKSKATKEYYTTDSIIHVPYGKFNLGISADDKTDQSFTFGIYSIEVSIDSVAKFSLKMNSFPYKDSRYINAGIDYFTKYNGGPYLQLLDRLSGNLLNIFSGNGLLQLNDDTTHEVSITVKDVMNNISALNFKIKRDSALSFSQNFTSAFIKKLCPKKTEAFENNEIRISINEKSLYDTVYLRYKKQLTQWPYISPIHSINDYRIPIHDSFNVFIKTGFPVADFIRTKTVMLLTSGKKSDAQLCTWDNNWAMAKWCNFGQFSLYYDSISPTITPVNIYDSAIFMKDRQIVFNAKDESSDIATFDGYIDGQWVIFSRKSNTFSYEFDDKCAIGWHTIQVTAKDIVGNKSEYSCSFYNGKK